MNTVETNPVERSLQRRLYMHASVSCASASKHPMALCIGEHTPFAQRGVVLIVSLVLLAAMTIIGIATLSGTRLNEQMASNAQQKYVAFEAAESAIESVVNYDALFDAITSDPNAAFNNPAPMPIPYTTSRLKDGFDLLDDDNKGIDIDGDLSVQYCGEVQPIGTSLNAALDSGSLTAILVDINSTVDIVNSNARADHLRRVAFSMPQTGRTGNCTVR